MSNPVTPPNPNNAPTEFERLGGMKELSERWQPAFSRAVQAAWEEIGREVAAEMNRKDEEIRRLQSQAARVDELKEKNRVLSAELAEIRTEAGHRNHLAPGLRPDHQSISNESPIADTGDSGLLQKYQNLKADTKKVTAAAVRWKSAKESWERYATSLEVKTRLLQERLDGNGNISNLTSSTDAVPTAARGSPQAPGQFTPAPSNSSVPPVPLDRQSTAGDTSDGDQEQTALPNLRQPLGSVPGVQIKQEPSSDEPQVVSEKHLRRKPTTTAETAVLRRAKAENSSDPVFGDENAFFFPQESLDLDGREDEMLTPRKRSHLTKDGQSKLRATTATRSRYSEQLETQSSHRSLRSEQLPDLAPKRLFQHSGVNNERPRPSIQGVTESLMTSLADRSPSKSAFFEKRIASANRSHKRKRMASGLVIGVEDLAEDGEMAPGRARSGQAKESTDSAHFVGGKLDTLLRTDSPTKRPGVLQPIESNQLNRRSNLGTDLGKERVPRVADDRAKADTPNRQMKNRDISAFSDRSRRNLGLAGADAASLKTINDSALRHRPIEKLGLGDFKINPEHNDGQRVAYSEVVRKRSDRIDLDGCTDPQCCGPYFQGLAESEYRAAGPSILQRHEEMVMLEEYLGDEAYKLSSMELPEKKELWINARMRFLSKTYGRHRERFTRRPSPPGFWDADFPSTQEIETNRKEAERIERRMVEERRREALRKGGRWLFRDE